MTEFSLDKIHKCVKCRKIKNSMQIGKQDYSKNHRPFICEGCWRDWSEYFAKHSLENGWRKLFEEWLYDKAVERVDFT